MSDEKECTDFEAWFATYIDTNVGWVETRAERDAAWFAWQACARRSSPQREACALPNGWISVKDRLPQDGQSIAFVVRTTGTTWEYLNGRVLGGSYDSASSGFTVPGLGTDATHWMPLPAAPPAPTQAPDDAKDAQLAAMTAERDKLADALTAKVVGETMLTDMHIGNGYFTAEFEGGACRLFVDAFAQQLIESKAENYVETTFTSDLLPKGERLVVTIQRVAGKTPHQLRKIAEAERDAAIAAAPQEGKP